MSCIKAVSSYLKMVNKMAEYIDKAEALSREPKDGEGNAKI